MSRSPEPLGTDARSSASEPARLSALRRLGPVEGPLDPVLNDVVQLVSELFGVRSSLVTLIDATHQWVRAAVNYPTEHTARSAAFCAHTIRQRGVLVVPDAIRDARFADNPSVTGEPHIRFYAGAPLMTADGHIIGTLCAIDRVPHVITAYHEAVLTVLAEHVTTHLELEAPGRHQARRRDGTQARDDGPPGLQQLVRASSLGYLTVDPGGRITDVNPAACRMFGYPAEELLGTSADFLRHGHSESPAGSPAAAPFAEGTRLFRHRLGHEVLVRCSRGRAGSGSGASGADVVLLADLTARVTAHTDLTVAERSRQAVLATATDAYVRVDHRGVVLEWNLAATTLFGYPAEEALGRALTTLIVPEHLAGAHDRGLAHVAGGGASSLIGQALELPARHRDGRDLMIELTVWSTPADDCTVSFHAFCRDIGERVANREELRAANECLTAVNTELAESRQQLRAAFEASPTADAVIDADGHLVEVNPALCRFLGAEPAALVGRSWLSLFHEVDPRDAMDAVIEVLTTGTAVTRRDVRCLRADGRVVWGLLSLIAMSGDTRSGKLMLRIEDTSAHKELRDILVRQMSQDPVTGLASRMLFLERVREAVSSRSESEPVAVGVLLVTGLRGVIDRDGYAAGDQVLGMMARRMARCLEEEVTLAHLQPGVFGLLVPGGPLVAARAAERLVDTFDSDVHGPSGPVVLRAHVGISAAAAREATETEPDGQPTSSVVGRLVQDAEEAARRAAGDGSGPIAFASAEMRQAQERQNRMQVLISDALAEGTIQVAYQPVFDLVTGALIAVEALLRTTDSHGRAIPPLQLIPAAEKSGQIVDIGRRVLQLAAEQSARWRAEHGLLLPVAVNVSAVQLERADFRHDVLSAVRRAGVPPEALSLELTESVLLTSGSAGIQKLRDLRDAGVQLAIDDFGTGYASLSYLRDLPASTVKIDRSFVEGIPGDQAAVAIVTGVIGLANNFAMTCIAEGIENEEQRGYLAERGVHGQGFLLGRPVSGADISRLLGEAPRAPLSTTGRGARRSAGSGR